MSSQFRIGSEAEKEVRATHDVFRNATKQDETFKSRFASSGRFTAEELESGEVEAQSGLEQPAEAEFDPNDSRSLYERLKEQRDAKQEDFEHKSAFKNQMDHWRLDEDDAAFEDERQERHRQQRVEAARLHEESSQFYQLARAVQERTIQPPPRLETITGSHLKRPALSGEKRKSQPAKRLLNVKVVKVAATSTDGPSTVPPPESVQAVAEEPGDAPTLPGMAAYEDDSSSEG
jgi:hypothetical protein